MSKKTARLGGYVGGIGVGLLAVFVLALGAWIGDQRATAPDAGDGGTTPLAVVQPQNGDDGSADVPAGLTATATAPPEAATKPSDPDQSAQSQPTDEDVSENTAARVPPKFDEVRREPDGMTVIAGRAAPGALVQILLDGVSVATTTADRVGKFATIAMLAPDGQAHVLSLLAEGEGGETASEDQIILAPVAPVVVAEAQSTEDATIVEDPAQTVKPADARARTEAPAADTAASQRDDPSLTDTSRVTDEDPAQSVRTADAEPESVPGVPATVDKTVDKTMVGSADPVSELAATEAAGAQPTGTLFETGDAEPAIDQPQVAQGEAARAATVTATAPPGASLTDVTADKPTQTTAATDPAQADAPDGVAVLKSTADGVEVLQPAVPQAMTNVALDTISYSEAGDVRLAGRAQSKANEVRVYLDNAAIITLPVDPDGRWRGDLPNVDEGIYTLRVDEVSADGTVSSRVETPFKRESASVLAAASAGQNALISAITVQKGDTLWAISRTRYGDPLLYVKVFEANAKSIRDPDLIYPGQVFDLPDQ